jgi:hypothetical protein
VRQEEQDQKVSERPDQILTTWKTNVHHVGFSHFCNTEIFFDTIDKTLTSYFIYLHVAPPHCEYTDSPGRYLPVADKFIPRIYSHEDCRRSCDTEPEFQCRAFSFHAYRRECLLSSDDTHSSGIALLPDPEFFYGERGTCNNGS